MRQLYINSITVKGQAIYGCSICGDFASGDSVTVEVNNPAEIAEIKPGPNAMPIGWSSNSGDDGRGDYLTFRYPNCRMSTPVADRSNNRWHRYYQIPPQDKSIEQCRSHGEDHRAYGWIPQYDPRWSPEQKAAYWAGYEPLTPSA